MLMLALFGSRKAESSESSKSILGQSWRTRERVSRPQVNDDPSIDSHLSFRFMGSALTSQANHAGDPEYPH
jgi:hypothetical protein